MAINAIGGSTAASAGAASSIGLQDFMRILLTQLNYQDPLKPMDNQEFMAQMAQFTALQQTQQLNEKISQLISNQAALQSVGLIGRTVNVSTTSGSVIGTVSALSLQGDSPLITVTTTSGTVMADVSLSQIVSVR